MFLKQTKSLDSKKINYLILILLFWFSVKL